MSGHRPWSEIKRHRDLIAGSTLTGTARRLSGALRYALLSYRDDSPHLANEPISSMAVSDELAIIVDSVLGVSGAFAAGEPDMLSAALHDADAKAAERTDHRWADCDEEHRNTYVAQAQRTSDMLHELEFAFDMRQPTPAEEQA